MEKIPRMLIKRTIKEIEALKLNATKEEKKRLDFSDFRPTQYDKCIYGQMTGDCYSKRAGELIKASCSSDAMYDIVITNYFGTEPKKVSGDKAKKAVMIRARAKGREYYHSSLELFTATYPKHNQNILGYIKDTSRKLKLNDLLVSK